MPGYVEYVLAEFILDDIQGLKKKNWGAGEMAQQLRVHVVLPES